ncbi:hypothetical protein [Phytoactinopolyspora alkaliphila]|uniref:hypothetical protein n=1 Tax=Phytoactinopolyspora alkaliphila TaxID=1783498 RepID=UPI001C206A84|nr:hypothetical protein [Phytoactinopolyspora alkaliphila]
MQARKKWIAVGALAALGVGTGSAVAIPAVSGDSAAAQDTVKVSSILQGVQDDQPATQTKNATADSPNTPNTPDSPQSPASPASPASPNTPDSPQSPASPASPASPNTPDSPQSPASPASADSADSAD